MVLLLWRELFKMIFLVSMQIVVEGWRVQPAMFMSKMIGLIKFQKKEDGEDDMLDMAFEPKTNSRLSCHIIVSDELDGLEVNIPSQQA